MDPLDTLKKEGYLALEEEEVAIQKAELDLKKEEIIIKKRELDLKKKKQELARQQEEALATKKTPSEHSTSGTVNNGLKDIISVCIRNSGQNDEWFVVSQNIEIDFGPNKIFGPISILIFFPWSIKAHPSTLTRSYASTISTKTLCFWIWKSQATSEDMGALWDLQVTQS